MSAMKKCSSSSDRLRDLPSNITESILMFLPIRDMVRTSVLSKKWRFRWVQVPELIFEDDSKMFQSPEEDRNNDNLNIVTGILLQHHGPIRKFKLDMSSWNSCYGIDKIFQFLSRNGIQELSLLMPRNEFQTPPSIYSCVELTHLSLKCCSVKPLTLVGFKKLVTLELVNVDLGYYVTICGCPYLQYLILQPLSIMKSVTIDAPNLKSLVLYGAFGYLWIKKAPPLLKDLSLAHGAYRFIVEKKSNLIECLSLLPLLENLCLSGRWVKKTPLLKVLSVLSVHTLLLEKESKLMEFLTSFHHLENLSLSTYFIKSMAHDSPNELPTMLNKLRMLRLTDMDKDKTDQLSSVLRLIRSSPNLQKLEFTEIYQADKSQCRPTLQMLNSCNYSLTKLREVKFHLRTDPRNYLEFFKFILAISPELETLYIDPNSRHIDLSCCKTLLKFACTRRASPKADIVFLGLHLDN